MSELYRQVLLAKYYRGLRFLVVDDFENFRLSLKQMITGFGVETVETASNGEDAVARCQVHEFDVILCDYNLGPGKNGQQVLEELRYNKLLKETSIFIMVTAETSKDMVMGALEYLPDGYITKPITKAVLQKRLDSMIEQREMLKPINEAIDKGSLEQAIQLVNRELQSQTKYASWCLRRLAGLHYALGDFQAAKKIYEDVLAKRDIGWAHLGLGKVNLALENFDAAIEGLTDLINKNPNLIEAYDWLSEAQLRKGKAKDAQATLKSAVGISPLAILRQSKLAEVSTQNKDLESAADAFRKTVKLGHNSVHESPQNYLNFGRCLSELVEGDTSEQGKKRAKEAISTLERAAKKFKDNNDVMTSALLIESRVYKGQGDENKARQALQQAKQNLDPDKLTAETGLEFARTLYSLGDVSEAEQTLFNLASKYADNQSIVNAIEDMLDEPVSLQNKLQARQLNKQGIQAFDDGRLDEAIKVFDEALALIPKHPALNLNSVQVMLKQIQEQAGNPELKRKCEACLQNVAHIPSQHRQYKRYEFLRKKVDAL
jgi:CheY-like chemotaxis protein/Tfp pilus assembly protein PilF